MGYVETIEGRKRVKLSDFDPSAHGDLARADGETRAREIEQELAEIQEFQYAAQDTAVLIVLQGLDTAGKDGTIRHVMGYMNPQSCRVASFKVPTPIESAHDFLWRIHAETPALGTTTIFNRSHYEDVLIVRVHELVRDSVWKRRYDAINNFEQMLADAGVVIMKFFLYISKDEQEQRLLEREKDPTKAWKLSAADWKEREFWDKYMEAYEDVLNRCSKPHAPWFVVPANHKWFRDLVIAEAIAERLRPMRDGWLKRLKDIGAAEIKLLQEQRRNNQGAIE